MVSCSDAQEFLLSKPASFCTAAPWKPLSRCLWRTPLLRAKEEEVNSSCFLLSLSYLLLCLSAIEAEEPWGKDHSLASTKEVKKELSSCQTPLFGKFAEVMIAFHQQVISPCDGPRSHYIPSSSQYTLEAMRVHGFFKGFLMGCDRLMRENKEEWVYQWTLDGAGHAIKWDPIPLERQKKRGR